MDFGQTENDASGITSYILVVMEDPHNHAELYCCSINEPMQAMDNFISLVHNDGCLILDRSDFKRVIGSTSLEKALRTLDRMSDTEGNRRDVVVMGDLDVIEQQILSDRNNKSL